MKSLGFPVRLLQQSPLKNRVKSLSSTAPFVPKMTPSSPWLKSTQTKLLLLLWSSSETAKHLQIKNQKNPTQLYSPVSQITLYGKKMNNISLLRAYIIFIRFSQLRTKGSFKSQCGAEQHSSNILESWDE